MSEREQMAREAFWGGNVALNDAVLETLGYDMDSQSYAANGATPAEYIAVVTAMSDGDIAKIMALA